MLLTQKCMELCTVYENYQKCLMTKVIFQFQNFQLVNVARFARNFRMRLFLEFQNVVQGWKELTAWPGIVTLGVWKGPLSVSMLCLPYWYGRGRRSGINASDWACLVSDGRLCNRPRKSPMSRFTTRSLTRIIIQGFANTQSRLFRILWTFHIR